MNDRVDAICCEDAPRRPVTDRVAGRVLCCLGGFYYVLAEEQVFECRARGLLRRQEVTPLAGDLAELTPGGETGSGAFGARMTGVLEAVLPRRSVLVRPPVANVEVLVAVASVREPQPQPRMLDQLLAAAHMLGLTAAVAVNKCDLAPEEARAFMAVYRAAGVPVFGTSVPEDEGIGALRTFLAGKIAVLGGNSGVGKSSLLGALAPALSPEVGGVSRVGRGRHTTRAVTLYPVGDGFLADTPGFSMLDAARLCPMPRERLADCFADFAAFTSDCGYASCTHTKETDCGVRAAVARGELAASRHASYMAMYEALTVRY